MQIGMRNIEIMVLMSIINPLVESWIKAACGLPVK